MLFVLVSSSKEQEKLYQLVQEREHIKELIHRQPSHATKRILHTRVYLQTTCTWTSESYLVSFIENPPLDSYEQNMTCCMIRGRNSTYDAPCNPFSLSTANITHDGSGSKQVDPRLTVYKR